MDDAQRPKPRIPLQRRVRLSYRDLEDFTEAVTANISESGMFIKTATSRPVGMRFDFNFRLTDGSTLVEGIGQVVWLRVDEDGAGTGMGVRFLYLPKESAELVRRIVAEHRGEGIAPFDLDGEEPR